MREYNGRKTIVWIIVLVVILLGVVYLVAFEPQRTVHSIEDKYCKDKENGSYSWSPCDSRLLPYYIPTCSANFTIDTICNNHKAKWKWK